MPSGRSTVHQRFITAYQRAIYTSTSHESSRTHSSNDKTVSWIGIYSYFKRRLLFKLLQVICFCVFVYTGLIFPSLYCSSRAAIVYQQLLKEQMSFCCLAGLQTMHPEKHLIRYVLIHLTHIQGKVQKVMLHLIFYMLTSTVFDYSPVCSSSKSTQELFLQKQSEHTDRNIELKPTVLFRTSPYHLRDYRYIVLPQNVLYYKYLLLMCCIDFC